MRCHFTSLAQWRIIADAGQFDASAALTSDPEPPLTEATRVRISARVRRDARASAVPCSRWSAVTDRVDNAIEWAPPPPAPCSLPRSAFLRPPRSTRA